MFAVLQDRPSLTLRRILPWIAWLALTVAAGTAVAGPALSKEQAAQRGKALQVFKQGKTAYKAGDYDAALKFFRQAQAIYQHEALIILALAKTLDRAKDIEKAQHYYKLFLKEAPPTDRARAKTVERIKAIEDELARRPAVLVLQDLPTAAVLLVDGKNAVPNAKGELELAAGSHRVVVTLPHHYPFKRDGIVLKPGERMPLAVVLHRVPDPSTLPRDHKWTWVAGTATGVGMIVTGVFALQSFFKRNEFFELADENGAPTDKGREQFNCAAPSAGGHVPLECPEWDKAVSQIKSDYEWHQTATAVSGLVAAGLGVATAVAYFAAPVKSSQPPKTSFLLAPTGPRSIGLTLRF